MDDYTREAILKIRKTARVVKYLQMETSILVITTKTKNMGKALSFGLAFVKQQVLNWSIQK